MKDPLKELEEQSKSLQELKVKSIENLLSSMDEKLELIFKSLVEE
jgi:hypothetical protein